MTADTLGGVLHYAEQLARGLVGRGVEVFLATMGAPLRPGQRRALEALGPRMHVLETQYALEWMADPWSDVDRAGEWLLALAADIRPDVVHLNGYSHAALSFRCPTVVVAHSCVLSWWRAVHDCKAPSEYDVYRGRVKQGLMCAGGIVAPSRAMARALVELHGVAADVLVIHNGRDARAHAAQAKHPFVLSLGRVWDEAKNMAALDDAASELTWPVRIAGATDFGRPVSFRHAEYLGSLDGAAVSDLLAHAAIYAHPARYEPFGLSILEAALSACALVLGDIPSLRELWGDAACYVDPRDHRALGKALRDLIADDPRRVDLGRRAQLRALRYSAERMTSRYVHLYEQLLGRRHTSDPVEAAPCG